MTSTAAAPRGGGVAITAPTDAALARAALAGDRAAFAALYERHEQRAFNLACRITGSREDGADASQEAFVRVLARLPRLAGRELDFGAYLLTAVRHASYDVIACSRRAQPAQELPDSARPVGAAASPPPEEDPGRRVLLAAQQEEIRAANGTLPPRQREALALRELEGLSYDEIAGQMGMNRNSVAQLISRARIGLRDALRRTALLSIAPTTPACARALGLVAMRDDGEIGGDAWLDEHLTACETCALAREAMAEAGASYRAWAPISALEAMRRETIAQAGERLGHDWSQAVTRAPARAPRRRLRRDGLVAVAAGVVLLLALLAPHTQDGVVEAEVEPPVAAAPVPTPSTSAQVTPPVAAAAAARASQAKIQPARRPAAPLGRSAAPSRARSQAPSPARPAPRSRTPRTPPLAARPPAGNAAPGVIEEPAGDVDTTPPPQPPPPPPPPRSTVTTFVVPPPPPPPPRRRIVPRVPSGGSSGVPVP